MGQSKVGAFCDKLIEAGWLAVVVIVPLFFNVYSSRVFEPDKIKKLMTKIGFQTYIYAGTSKKLWNKKMKSAVLFVGVKK